MVVALQLGRKIVAVAQLILVVERSALGLVGLENFDLVAVEQFVLIAK